MRKCPPSRGNALSRFRSSAFARIASIALVLPGLSTFTVPSAMANPSGGVIVHGNVNIGSGAGGNLQINQASQNAIINWDSFSIGAGELTQFNQPGVNAAVLNRVTGGSITDIQGALQANGNVFVINPNGIVIGATGTVDVHGLVLSTLDVSDGEFLARGDMLFSGNSQAGVTNMGRINAIGGDVFLIGRTIDNAAGATISANNGTVGLAAGQEVLLAAAPNFNGERVFVRATGSGVSGTGILNDGTIEGAAVELKAHGNLYALAINNKGTVRATGVSNYGGSVYLRGMGGSVHNTGTIQATRPGTGSGGRVLIQAAYAKVDGMIKAEGSAGQGGEVRIQGWNGVDIDGSINVGGTGGAGGSVIVEGDVIDLGSNTVINASGDTGGGSVNIGGGYQGSDGNIYNADNVVVNAGAEITVDANVSGSAGTAIIWSDFDTIYEGEISARALYTSALQGGLVEVSGKENLLFAGDVLRNGATLLLDPTNFNITNDNFAPAVNRIGNQRLSSLLNDGNVVISTSGAGGQPGWIRVQNNADVRWDSDYSLTLRSHERIRVEADIQNAGNGDVILEAGANSAGGWGSNANQMVLIGNAEFNGRRAAVGSRFGDTTIRAYGVEVVSGNGWAQYAQIGFHDSGLRGGASDALGGSINAPPEGIGAHASWGQGKATATGIERGNGATGNILVDTMAGGVLVRAGGQTGTNGGDNTHAMIGHGGWNWTDNPNVATYTTGGDFSGDITVRSTTGDIHLLPGATSGNGDRRNFTQIGHGGRRNDGAQSGTITVATGGAASIQVVGGDTANSYSQIGHGGWVNRGGAKSGTINVTSGSGGIMLAGGRHVSNNNWTRSIESYAQIGHGGREADVAKSGAININAGGGNLTALSGDGIRNYAQVGHGGERSGGSATGAITVSNAADITFDSRGFGTGALGIGNEGGQRRESYTMLGHGGFDADGDHSGAITVTHSGDMNFFGGDRVVAGDRDNFAMLGHGGLGSRLGGNGTVGMTGAITVTTGGDMNFLAGKTNDSFVQLGHGGHASGGNHSGDMNVTVTGDMTFAASVGGNVTGWNDDSSLRSYAQLGHGGAEARGDHTGDVTVTANSIKFTGGDNLRSYAQLGLGGAETDNGGANSVGHVGDLTVTTTGGDIEFTAGTGRLSYAQLGNGGRSADGNNSGDILVDSAGAVKFRGGAGGGSSGGGGWGGNGDVHSNENYAQLGNGGYAARGDHSGNITVNAVGDIDFEAGNTLRAYAQLGNGGAEADNINNQYPNNPGNSGNIAVTTSMGNIIFKGGTGGVGTRRDNYAQIGHGGYHNYGNHSGSIDVTATVGNIAFTGGGHDKNYAQIGHGGERAWGDHSGNISVTAGDGIDFNGGTDDRTNVQIGHGGHSDEGSLTVLNGNITGDIAVTTTGGSVTFNGSGSESYAQIGHLGMRWNGTANGNITVTSDAEVTMAASGTAGGNQWTAYTQMGHGGYQSRGDKTGNITVVAGSNVNVDATNGREREFAQIGHGGWGGDPNNDIDGNDTGNILITSGGAVNVLGSDSTAGGRESYAQVGHGGFRNGGTKMGSVTITAADDVLVEGGSASHNQATAQVGHGGHEARGNKTGDIAVTSTGGKVRVAAGSPTNTNQWENSGTIGHGGVRADGVSNGNIAVEADGNVELAGGTSRGSSAQIGHGVREERGGGNTGNIHVGAGGDILMTSGTGERAYVQIGHGGENTDGSHTGDICIHADGNISIDATTAIRQISYAQVGHGGWQVNGGNHSGFITAVAGGNLDVLGGGAANHTYAHLGHGGGENTGGNLSGSISVVTGGNVNVTGGTLANSGGMIGHGTANNATNGTRDGGLNVYAAGSITMTDGTGGSNALISHQTNAGIGSVSYTGQGVQAAGDNGYSLVAGAGFTVSASQQNGPGAVLSLGETVAAAIADGDVTFANGGATNDLTLSSLDDAANSMSTALASYNSIHNITFAAGRHVNVDINVQNQGTGDTTLIAGWDSNNTGNLLAAPLMGPHGGAIALGAFCLPDYQPIPAPASCMEFGLNGGLITIGSGTQTGGLAFGSNQGNTTALGYGMVLNGSNSTANAHAQLGYRTDGSNATGDIFVHLHEGHLTMNSGSQANSYTQIGHGGTGATNSTIGTGGNNADIEITFCDASDVILNGGGGATAYAMIGHGGDDLDGAKRGDILVDNFNDIDMNGGTGNDSFTQIGHGGWRSGGLKDGDITISAAPTASASGATPGVGGNIDIDGGTSTRSYSQIGHGGRSAGGNKVGDILVENVVDVTVDAGSTTDAYAQIGHGGRASGGTKTGSVEVYASGNVAVDATGTGGNANAQIGHGGLVSNGDINGPVTVIAGGTVDVLSGNSNNRFAMIGNGGSGSDGTKLNSDVTVQGTQVTLTSGSGGSSFTQIGSGGGITNAANTTIGDVVGNVTVNATAGTVTATGGSGTQGYSQIGNGGSQNPGNLTGAVDIDATGTIAFNGGTGTNSYAQAGHGGNGTSGVKQGDITVDSSGGSVIAQGAAGGTAGAAQIGHGGNGSSGGTSSGSISVNAVAAGQSVQVLAGAGADAFAMIGNGGLGASGNQGAAGDFISVQADNVVDVIGSGATNGFAQIGSGGLNSNGDVNANVSVNTATGAINVHGGTGTDSYGQIGNGGSNYVGNSAGNVNVVAGTGIDIRSGAGTGAGANIGSGGSNMNGSVTGDVNATSQNGNIVVSAAAGGLGSSAQIGNIVSGAGSNATVDGDVRVDANNGSVIVLGGAGNLAYSQIGNGGAFGNGDFTGETRVDADIDINLIAPNRAGGSYAKIGQGDDMQVGAFAGTGNREGDIQIGAGSNILVSDGFVGHVNKVTLLTPGKATSTNSDTYVAPSRNNPSSGTGFLITTPGSEFASSDDGGELRFYFPRRANNLMAAGTVLNCTSYIGTQSDPALQRADEFVRNIIGNLPSTPLEHDNLDPFYGTNFGAGGLSNGNANYSLALGNYSLYYDTAEIPAVLPPPPPPPPPAPVPVPPPPPQPDPSRHFPDDRYSDDVHWSHYEDLYRFRRFEIWYEGFDHYAREGESIFSYRFGNGLDTRRGTDRDFELETPRRLDGAEGDGNFDVRFEGRGVNVGEDEEDILRRQRRQLEEQADQ